jgi:hypothetical protein
VPLNPQPAIATGRSGATRPCTYLGRHKQFPTKCAIAFEEPFSGSNGYGEDLIEARWEEVLLSEYGQQWRVWFTEMKNVTVIDNNKNV